MLRIKDQRIILEILEENCIKEGKEIFHSPIYADYRDEISPKNILKICRSDDPQQEFDENIESAYEFAEWDCEKELLQKIKENETIENSLANGKLNEYEILDFIRDHHCVSLPFDHFLNQELYINLIVNTGDSNTDFTINQPFASWDGQHDTVIDEESAILWLARQQGYKKRDLTRALRDRKHKNSKFLASMLNEVENVTSNMNALTFLAKMTFAEWFRLHDAIAAEDKMQNRYHPKKSKGRGFIVLNQDTVCGLYDPWNGAGGPLEIVLERDVRLPIRYIDSCWPDGGRGYSIESIYGICKSVWHENAVKLIHPMKQAA